MRESSPGGSYGTASRGGPLRAEVFPDEVRLAGSLCEVPEGYVDILIRAPLTSDEVQQAAHEQWEQCCRAVVSSADR
jgi:hypothetical protein